jgi:hypothetical protein
METVYPVTQNKWYNKTWLVVILCLVFFPIGLYALWKSNTKTNWKIAWTVLIGWIVFVNARNMDSTSTASADVATTAPEKEQTLEEKSKAAEAKIKEQLQTDIAARENNTLTPEQLVGAYTDNEVRADGNFKGKTFYVDGVIESIGKDIMDKPYVSLKSDDVVRSVQCMLDSDAEAAQLNKGERVTVKGTCKGMMMNVLLDDATVVPSLKSLKSNLKAMK